MTTNAEQAFWKFWQVTALSWTSGGHKGGRNFTKGAPWPRMEPPLTRPIG